MDLEIVNLSEVSQRKTNIIVELICGIKKNDTNKLIYKIETYAQRKQTYGCQRRGNGGTN